MKQKLEQVQVKVLQQELQLVQLNLQVLPPPSLHPSFSNPSNIGVSVESFSMTICRKIIIYGNSPSFHGIIHMKIKKIYV